MKTIEELQTQINELQKELENLKNLPNYKRWRAKKGEEYFYLLPGSALSIDNENWYDCDNWRFDIWNYFKTKEEAEQARDRQLAIMRVNDRIDELNQGWEHNNNWKRCYIYFWDKFQVDYYNIGRYNNPLIIKHCKTEEIANQIIAEMKDDLNLIFNIK